MYRCEREVDTRGIRLRRIEADDKFERSKCLAASGEPNAFAPLPDPSLRILPWLPTARTLNYRRWWICSIPMPTSWARSRKCRPPEMPTQFRRLLAHEHHMTVTVEQFHQHAGRTCKCWKDSVTGRFYSRRILLTRQSDDRVVQFGIVRLNFEFLSPEVRRRNRKPIDAVGPHSHRAQRVAGNRAGGAVAG